MGKRKVKREDSNAIKLPAGNDVMGVVNKMLGFDRLMVSCQDGHERPLQDTR